MKPWEPQRRHRDPERAARLRALFKAGAAVAVIGVLTLLNALVPFFSLLPAALLRRGLAPLLHRTLPPGDGSIAYGQAAWGIRAIS